MTQRDEALEAAICGKRTHCELEFMAATAGADAELTRVVEWLRKVGGSGPEAIADALAAHAHWDAHA